MDISGSRVLITGGAGLVGSHLAEALVALDCNVRIIDSLEAYTHGERPANWQLPGTEFVHGSILDKQAMAHALQNVDYVFHQAAFTGFDPTSAKYVGVNTLGTANIFEVIAEQNCPVKKLVLASSLSVYGEGKYRCEQHGFQYPRPRGMQQLKLHHWDPTCEHCAQPLQPCTTDEASPVNPPTPYAVSKLGGEQLAFALGQRFQLPTVSLRYAVAYGPRQSVHNPYSTVVTTFATLLLNNRAPTLYEDGQQTRDWTYVGDIVAANLFAMQHDRLSFEVLNVGTGQAGSVADVAGLLGELLNKPMKPHMNQEFRPGDIRHLVQDVTKIRALGFDSCTPLAQGLGKFLDWFIGLGQVDEHYSGLEQRLRACGELRS